SRVKRKLRVGLIAVAQGADLYPNFNPKKKFRVNRLIQLGYQRSDHVVGVSGTMAQRARQLIGKTGTAVSVVHNGIDLPAWRAAQAAAAGMLAEEVTVARKFALEPGRFTLQVAGLRHVKRVDLAIGAVAKCRDIYGALGWKHVVAGEGKMLGACRSLAAELGVADRVVFAGLCTGLDKHWLFGNAQFLMHTSDEEGLPFVLAEAAASGLPLLVSAIQPHTEFLGGAGCGRTFAAGDVADLAAALRGMLRDDLAPMRAAALRRAEEFGSDRMLDSYERLCHEVVALAQSAS
ncbi:MAG TPA: glycosyltransferase family 4 protein, partial [Phycisphaerae bacterium]|nr:glycosyltransferase family 4 protein [Phycisphaerae bacterium]